jgi:hypothetical protein
VKDSEILNSLDFLTITSDKWNCTYLDRLLYAIIVSWSTWDKIAKSNRAIDTLINLCSTLK